MYADNEIMQRMFQQKQVAVMALRRLGDSLSDCSYRYSIYILYSKIYQPLWWGRPCSQETVPFEQQPAQLHSFLVITPNNQLLQKQKHLTNYLQVTTVLHCSNKAVNQLFKLLQNTTIAHNI